MPRYYSQRKKRKFHSNRFTTPKKTVEVVQDDDTAMTPTTLPQPGASGTAVSNSSSKKILPSIAKDSGAQGDEDFNIIVNFSLLKSLFLNYGHCPDCQNTNLALTSM